MTRKMAAPVLAVSSWRPLVIQICEVWILFYYSSAETQDLIHAQPQTIQLWHWPNNMINAAAALNQCYSAHVYMMSLQR